MTILVKEIIGPRCIIREDGQKIYDLIIGPLKKGEKVTLDFSGVSQYASPFFNFAVGQLFKESNSKALFSSLHLANLNETGGLVFERVKENAAEYHTDKNYQKIVDDIIEKQARESDI